MHISREFHVKLDSPAIHVKYFTWISRETSFTWNSCYRFTWNSHETNFTRICLCIVPISCQDVLWSLKKHESIRNNWKSNLVVSHWFCFWRIRNIWHLYISLLFFFSSVSGNEISIILSLRKNHNTYLFHILNKIRGTR